MVNAFVIERFLLVIVVEATSDCDSIEAVTVVAELPPNWVEFVLASPNFDCLIMWLELTHLQGDALLETSLEFVTLLELSLRLDLGADCINPLGQKPKVVLPNHILVVLSDLWLRLGSLRGTLLRDLVF